MSHLTICGLGPGDPGALTEATLAALSGPAPVYLRTARHPTADRAAGAASFDDLYDRADTFDEVYRDIAAELLAATETTGRVVYAVPGSPLVLERSVRRLRDEAGSRPDLDIEVLPALSFLDLAWTRLGVDPVDDGVRLVDGHRFATEAAGERGPLLVAHAHASWVLSDIKLALDVGPEQRVVVLQGLGTPDERIAEVPWPDLDRSIEPDHLTSLYLPELAAPVGHELARSIEMMGRLRRECPWDRAQDHHSLQRYLIEEAYEVVEAIGRLGGDDDAAASIELEEELGDLWFQILFHAELATEAGWFTLADVARTLTEKMINRHPHVYGDADAVAATSTGTWERVKAEEKGRESAMDDIPSALPALARADKTLKRAEAAGAPAAGLDDGLAGPIEALLPEGSTEADVGVALLAIVGRARELGVPAEESLRRATVRAVDRFRRGEADGAIPADWVRG